MRKTARTAALIVSALIMTAGMAGCGAGEKDIGRDAALEAALNDAGVNESDTTRLKVSEDRDDGRTVYEIRFDADGKEYEYEIQASDGKILSSEIETLTEGAQENEAQNHTADAQTESGEAQAQQNNTASSNTDTAGGSRTNPDVAVSLEDAKAIALERVPGAEDKDLKIELDYDDGVYKYEGDIIYGQKEYDFEIDANSGTILEWSEERY